MRRAISFLLVLVFCFSLACTAFAAVSSPAQSGTPTVTSNPKTGDMIMTWVVIMVVALIALAVVVVLYRKFAR